jgi:hypothetical protein
MFPGHEAPEPQKETVSPVNWTPPAQNADAPCFFRYRFHDAAPVNRFIGTWRRLQRDVEHLPPGRQARIQHVVFDGFGHF